MAGVTRRRMQARGQAGGPHVETARGVDGAGAERGGAAQRPKAEPSVQRPSHTASSIRAPKRESASWADTVSVRPYYENDLCTAHVL